MNFVQRISSWIENQFLILALFFSAFALFIPSGFLWIKPYIPEFLGLIMFGMGLTLEFSDFAGIFKKKRFLFLGTILQYTVMPVGAWILCTLFHLPQELWIGMIIVGACPGGTASNVVTYLADGNVALSVTLTLISTILSPLLTPLIIFVLLHKRIHLDLLPLVQSVFWIVAFPLFDGLVVRRLLKRWISPLLKIFPSLSILSIVLIIACVMALNQKKILTFPILILFVVVLHNAFGLVCGYMGTKLLGGGKRDCRTIAIEVGMQNSGLGVALAVKFFGSAAALPGALFSLWHNLSGISIAKYWKKDSL